MTSFFLFLKIGLFQNGSTLEEFIPTEANSFFSELTLIKKEQNENGSCFPKKCTHSLLITSVIKAPDKREY